jgi:hypothetical protein
MANNIILQGITPTDLVKLITEGINNQLSEVKNNSSSESLLNPHLTRKETAKFFDVSLNCVNDWVKKGILKPYKVGQRTYFKRSELLQVMFNSKTA